MPPRMGAQNYTMRPDSGVLRRLRTAPVVALPRDCGLHVRLNSGSRNGTEMATIMVISCMAVAKKIMLYWYRIVYG